MGEVLLSNDSYIYVACVLLVSCTMYSLEVYKCPSTGRALRSSRESYTSYRLLDSLVV